MTWGQGGQTAEGGMTWGEGGAPGEGGGLGEGGVFGPGGTTGSGGSSTLTCTFTSGRHAGQTLTGCTGARCHVSCSSCNDCEG